MRLREALLLAASVALLATACSRLTFVKPNAQRKGGERVAPEYTFKETEASKRRSEARRRLAAAEQQLQAGQPAAAEAEARAALKADPGMADAHTVMGLVLMNKGDGERAGSHYAEAAKLAPSGGTYNNYGAWLCSHQRAAESLTWFDQALTDPNYGDRAAAQANAGACAAKAGQYDRVERDLRAALDLDPGNAVALAAMAEEQVRQGRWLEARAFSERRLAAAAPTPAALQLASQIEENLGDRVAAARYVERLRTQFPQARTALPGETSQP
ncbi:MAG: type IV pilus biogenesis/stability protein PilW [Proteobacteria bacterium]|nr:type IV pilus biogenesis/stability protein PilW [Pseudomonadota bacterium]